MTDDLKPQPSRPQESQAMLDLEAVLNLPQGRRFVMEVLGQCRLYATPFTGEPATTNLALGKQQVGLWLIDRLEQLGPSTYPQLLLDAARQEKTETVRVLDQD